MPSLTNIHTRVTERIVNSGQTLDIVYPPAVPTATGVAPGADLVSPLTGPQDSTAVFTSEPAGYQTTLTVKCLWLDALTGREATDVVHTETRRPLQAGWVVGATSMARVLVSEVALDATNPYAGTKLDAASHIEFRGSRFKVIQITPVGASFGPPITYHVWMVGERVN